MHAREDLFSIRSYPHIIVGIPTTPVQGDMHVNAINGAPATHRVLFEPKAKPHPTYPPCFLLIAGRPTILLFRLLFPLPFYSRLSGKAALPILNL